MHLSSRIARAAMMTLAFGTAVMAQDGNGPRIVAPRTGPVELAGDETRVPMKYFGGRPVVEVRLNGKGPYPFILDTGAGGTVVDEALAGELDLPVVGDVNVGSPAGSVPVAARLVALDRISIGAAAATRVHASTMKLSALFDDPEAPRGILSALQFPDLLLTLDYPGDEVILRRGALPEADGETIFQWDPEAMLPTIEIEIAGIRIPAHVDTGSHAGVTLPSGYIERLPLASEPEEAGRARTVDAEMVILGAEVDGELKIGRHAFSGPRILFNERMPVGNIGSGILKRFAVTVDSRHNRIRLEEVGATE